MNVYVYLNSSALHVHVGRARAFFMHTLVHVVQREKAETKAEEHVPYRKAACSFLFCIDWVKPCQFCAVVQVKRWYTSWQEPHQTLQSAQTPISYDATIVMSTLPASERVLLVLPCP